VLCANVAVAAIIAATSVKNNFFIILHF